MPSAERVCALRRAWLGDRCRRPGTRSREPHNETAPPLHVPFTDKTENPRAALGKAFFPAARVHPPPLLRPPAGPPRDHQPTLFLPYMRPAVVCFPFTWW